MVLTCSLGQGPQRTQRRGMQRRVQKLRQHAGKRARAHAQDDAEPLQRLPSLLAVALQARQQRRDHCIHRTTGPALEQDAERRASRLLALKTAVSIYS